MKKVSPIEKNFKETSPHYCRCGCGGEIVWNKWFIYNGVPNYITGHWIKSNNPIAGKFGKNHPNYGKCIHNKEQKEIWGKKRKGSVPWNRGLTYKDDLRIKTGKNSPNWKGGKPKYLVCGKQLTNYINRSCPEHYCKNGENNPNWNNGSSFEPYCSKFNCVLKEQMRERDNRTCQLCGKPESENGRKLAVHHIHYDKENCDPDLISLCNKCNSKVNANRDYYEELFMNKLKERGMK